MRLRAGQRGTDERASEARVTAPHGRDAVATGSTALAFWRYGVMALWRYGVMALSRYGPP
eukprot:5106084-Prymnesium_polylepis.1